MARRRKGTGSRRLPSKLSRFRFTKADARACASEKGDRSQFGKCMVREVRKRLRAEDK